MRNKQKTVLTAFQRALSQEHHNLLERPEILWQQMYKPLQWADGDAATGKLLHIFPCIGSVCKCNFSPSGKMIAAGDKGGNVYLLDMYGFESNSFGIESEADSLTEQDPERFPSKIRNQKRQEDVQQSSDDLICPYCKSRNPAGSKWCINDGWELL